MTQSEFQALQTALSGLRLQFDDMSAKIGQLTTSQQLIEQRLSLDRTSAARETELIKALAAKEAEMTERLAAKTIEIKDSHFNFHLRALTILVGMLAIASFPQLIIAWKSIKSVIP